MKSLHSFLFMLLLIPLLTGCSAVRFVPKGRSMLTRVQVTSNNPQVAAADYRNYVRQEANSRWLSTLKVPLGIYCLSGPTNTMRSTASCTASARRRWSTTTR